MSTTKEQIDYSAFQFPELAKAVVQQIGGEEVFLNCWEDILNHGVSGGFGGFIYYSDTNAFAKRHIRLIREMAKHQADEFGVGMLEMIQGFNCLMTRERKKPYCYDYSIDYIGETVLGNGDDVQILNALAWYAAEETCHQFSLQQEA